ncbi:magnesium/cobalt transporter CorA [Flavobacterium azooxidireducens]|uniref:Magnesium transport protein CorA n=1 Tax=Flavobacterium azooxidireducens TaxID=1871076 RepID=A0ABY4KHA2_9FLAO|nr:magnesium/cobalt transporter CorA [Flavobacterium azooxidireducens]UPQ79088.1 magnesium/cobalt transporter CorA [Flavobacterium azooxidireducens]
MKRLKYKKGRKVQPNYFEYTGQHKDHPVEMQLFVYNSESYTETTDLNLDQVQIEELLHSEDVKWLNIHGLHDIELIKKIVDILQIENHIAADILNVTKRTRMEELGEVLFFSIKSILPENNAPSVHVEQISFILKDNLLVSFQEKRGDFFTHIRERIKTNSGIVCKKKNDFLLYLMLDAVMENFYITIEKYEELIEQLQIEAKVNESQDVLVRIEKCSEDLNFLKRALVPLKDSLFNLKSIQDDDDFNGIEKSNFTFFARLHQKSLELLEQIDYDMNSLESASSFYFSAQSHRMNEIMKTLTIVSVVFIPLTFIVGVYGMNFENIPELKSPNGYFITLGVMFLIVLAMIYYFRRKKWF